MGQAAANDLTFTLVVTWIQLVPASLRLASLFDTGVLVIVASLTFGLYGVLVDLASPIPRETVHRGLVFGMATFFFGMLPIWAIGERVAQGDYNQRYILVGMIGATLIVVSMLAFFIRNHRWLALAISIMVALAIGSHLHTGDVYRAHWEQERSFIWQLSWRAPEFEPNTALLSFEPAAAQLRDPMTGNALNVAYPAPGEPPSVDLWNFELGRTATVNAIRNGNNLTNNYRGLTFSTNSLQDLVFYHQPAGGCLWILTPLDIHNPYLPTEDRDLVAFSNVNNILPASVPGFPPEHVFGAEPQRDWCYYFEKASLAAQHGDWSTVRSLMDEAESLDFAPGNGIEWLPLLTALLDTGDITAALSLTERVHAFDPKVDPMLCAYWQAYPGEYYAQAVAIVNCESQ